MHHSLKISVIIPVYNREDSLGDAVDSVLAQTRHPDLVEIVLVDDGSTDGSSAICDHYAHDFPERVKVVHKLNGGVATALNEGVQASTGDVIGFLGSDDYLSIDALEAVGEFFCDRWNECDLAAIAIEMVGSRSGPHWNNRKRFVETGVLNVEENWNAPHMHGGGTFIKSEVFSGWGLKFDPALFMTEDATLNTQVIMRKMAYGVISGPRYYNRRYVEGSESQVSNSHHRTEFYSVLLKHAYQRIFDDAISLYGSIPKYVQAVCAYDLVFRMRGDTSILGEADREEYRNRLAALLQQMSVRVIRGQRAPIEQRLNMLSLREGRRLADRLDFSDGLFSLDGTPVYSLRPGRRVGHRPAAVVVDRFEVTGGILSISGTLRVVLVSGDHSFHLCVGSQRIPIETEDLRNSRPPLVDDVASGLAFSVQAPLVSGDDVSFEVTVTWKGSSAYTAPLELVMGKFTRFSGNGRLRYFRRDDTFVYRQVGKHVIRCKELTVAEVARAELGFLRRARKAGAPTKVLARRVRELMRKAPKDEIWLLADHKQEAGDNAEAMFRYLCAHPNLGVRPVLSLAASAPGWEELAALGEVVEPGSPTYFRRFFDAAVVLNSAADDYMINPLGADRSYLQDRLPPLSVFLQHGVTKDDQSAWLNYRRKGFDVFVTSAFRERDSILEGAYGYKDHEVALVGMPRFDRLRSEPNSQIVFAPTWRKSLVGDFDPATGKNAANESFVESAYFRLWQQVICHERLNEALAAYGFSGVFALHPSHSAEIEKFSASEKIGIASYPYDYGEFFSKGNILVTDYSSVAFDFAYLRKPVVYLQSDSEEFFSGHLYSQGYFSYEEDGFGPVVSDVESLVDVLVDMVADRAEVRGVKSDVEVAYGARADEFFAFEGGGNSRRLYDHIRSVQAR